MRYLVTTFFIVLLFSFAIPVNAATQKYTCPMHPHYIADRPGSCPICGMDLTQMDVDEQGQATRRGKVKEAEERSIVTISPETIQNTGIRTEQAEMASFGTLVRSYGDLTENVRLQSDISSRVEGWVENLKVSANGDRVKVGDLLFTLYSPALVSAQQDLMSAMQTGIKGRINSSTKRLSSLGMQKRAIQQLKTKRKPFQKIPFYATVDGLIRDINIREGSYIQPGMRLMALQNYDTVWVDVSIAEQDIPYITTDTKAIVSLPALGMKDKKAQIDYIYPTIDRATRTGRVRLVLENKDGALKPGAYADVEFETGVEKRLSIPSDAILKSKDGEFIVLSLGEGRFQPRKILTGLHYRGRTEVLSGLQEHDSVVVSGQFLIDSESALRESLRKMQRMQKSLAMLDIGDDQLAMINHLIDAALYIHETLDDGELPHAKMILPALTLGDHLMPVYRGTKLQFVLEDAENALTKAKKSVTQTEWKNSLNALVVALKPWLLEGRPQYYKKKGLQLYHVKGQGRYWLQQKGQVNNPYGDEQGHLLKWPENMPDDPSETSVGGGHAHH